MKIDKSYLLITLLVVLLVSVFLNVKSCSRPPIVVHDQSQKKIDSLLVVNKILDVRVDSLSAEVSRDISELVSLKDRNARLDEDIKKRDEIIRRQKAVIADNDRKISAIKNSRIDVSDDDLSDMVKSKLPK